MRTAGAPNSRENVATRSSLLLFGPWSTDGLTITTAKSMPCSRTSATCPFVTWSSFLGCRKGLDLYQRRRTWGFVGKQKRPQAGTMQDSHSGRTDDVPGGPDTKPRALAADHRAERSSVSPSTSAWFAQCLVPPIYSPAGHVRPFIRIA